MDDLLYQAALWAPGVLLAITLHEAAHGYAAMRLGDDTAAKLGRVTLNPFKHIDPVGTLLIPGLLVAISAPFLFGWAKPVPVRPEKLRRPRQHMAWVAAAGPAANFLMALIAALLFWVAFMLEGAAREFVFRSLENTILINILLMMFNLLPIPPLDGGRVVFGLLPRALALRYVRIEPYGLFLVFALLLLPFLLQPFGIAFNPIGLVLGPAVEAVGGFILALAGHDF